MHLQNNKFVSQCIYDVGYVCVLRIKYHYHHHAINVSHSFDIKKNNYSQSAVILQKKRPINLYFTFVQSH